MVGRRALCAVALLLVIVAPTASLAEDAPISAFFGEYVGHFLSTPGIGINERDLNVSIEPKGRRGFTVHWTTFSKKRDGEIKRKSYTIDFFPTARQGIYSSAMAFNKFGRRVPLDPMQGEPYVWARIREKTLTVFAMIVTADGGYEMQTYDRTLTDKGLRLRFSRIRDGRELRLINADLLRVGG